MRIGEKADGPRNNLVLDKDEMGRIVVNSDGSFEKEDSEVNGGGRSIGDVAHGHRSHRHSTAPYDPSFLASIIESSNDAIVGKSLQGMIQTWNTGAEKLFGYTAEQAIGSHISLIIPEERLRDEKLILNRISAGEWVEHYETVRRTMDGSMIDVSITVSPIRNESGEIVGASKIARDISDRTRTKLDLHHSEERYRALAEASATVVWRTSPDGEVIFASDHWNTITGQSDQEKSGWGWLQSIHPEDQARTIALWNESLQQKTLHENQFRVRTRDGNYRWFSVRGVPVFNVDGSIREWVGANTDFHDRKMAEDALRSLAADLSDMDRRKDEFLATLAHELRNPLAPIRSGLGLLQLKGISGEEADETRLMIERQLAQLVRLVDDLMDVSRIATGKIELRRKSVHLQEVLQSAIETSQSLIQSMNHELVVSMPASPFRLDADLTRLAQVFLNLLNNAAKYSEPNGKIFIDVNQDGNEVVVSVRDSGIGISSEHLPHVFEMFSQADHSIEKSCGGLGIGLALVRRLVEMHGGSVKAVSEGLGKGSEFIVRLPIHSTQTLSASAQEVNEKLGTQASLRILIVDDNRDSALTLSMLLSRLGHQTQTAFDGEEALAASRSFNPEAVLLDIGLPKLNGYEVCRWIRSQNSPHKVVIIAQTGWGQEETRRKTSDAGFDYHMVKPLDLSALRRILDTL